MRTEQSEALKMEWQPIETAPKDGSEFIGVSFGIGGFGLPEMSIYSYSPIWKSFQAKNDYECIADYPDFWMPLPEPPK